MDAGERSVGPSANPSAAAEVPASGRVILELERLWCVEGTEPKLDEDGFFSDLMGVLFGKSEGPFKTLADLSETPCVVLLGGPGLGKSTDVERYIRNRAPEAQAARPLVHVDLRHCADRGDVEALVEGSPGFGAWLDGEGSIEIVLDHLDEFDERIASGALAIASYLGRQDSTRTWVRIVSRANALPAPVRERLRVTWPNHETRHIVRLRGSDVAAIARARGLDSDRFLTWVHQVRAEPLAALPRSLGRLIDIFTEAGAAGVTRRSVFAAISHTLAEEPDVDRARGRFSLVTFGPSERVHASARVAAMCLLTGRAGILSHSSGRTTGSPQYLEQVDLHTEAGMSRAPQQYVSQAAIADCVRTGLFESVGDQRFRPVHGSLAAFLAAECLRTCQLSTRQLRTLLCDGRPDEHVVEPLGEVASWVATWNGEFASLVLKSDPHVVLKAFAKDKPAALQREALSGALQKVQDGLMTEDDVLSSLGELPAEGLPEVLRPWIADGSRSQGARRTAVYIARQAKCVDVIEDLMRVALDSSAAYALRVPAAATVSELVTDDALESLRALISLPDEQDPDDELRGITLRALWPRRIPVGDLLGYLRPPQREHLVGMYSRFLFELSQNPPKGDDLVAILTWLRGKERSSRRWGYLERLTDACCLAALEQDAPDAARDLVADIVVHRARECEGLFVSVHDDQFGEKYNGDYRKRIRLVEGVCKLLGSQPQRLEEAALRLRVSPWRLFSPSDVPFLLKDLAPRLQTDQRRALAVVVKEYSRFQGPLALEPLREAAITDEILRKEFEDVLQPQAISAGSAAEVRKWQEREERLRKVQALKQAENAAAYRKVKEEGKGDLKEAVKGHHEKWWPFCLALTIADPSAPDLHQGNDWTLDVTTLPGWTWAVEAGEGLVIDAAMLAMANPPVSVPLRGSLNAALDRPALAWLKAIVLLWRSGRLSLDQLSDDAKRKACATAFSLGVRHDMEEGEFYARLLAELRRAVPAYSDEDVKACLREGEGFRLLVALRKSWDPRLSELVAGEVLAMPPGDQRREGILLLLAEVSPDEAASVASEILKGHLATPGSPHPDAVLALRVLIHRLTDQGWRIVERVAAADEASVRAAFLWEATDRFMDRWVLASRLSEGSAADLYLLLLKLFPRAEDPDPGHVHALLPRLEVAYQRDGIISHLRGRGTHDAVRAMERLRDSLPAEPWLVGVAADAASTERRAAWVPPTAHEVARLLEDPGMRHVQSHGHLADLVLESLERWQEEMLGLGGSVEPLWDQQVKYERGVARKLSSNRCWRPKREVPICEQLAVHLRRDLKERGAVVDREVQVRRVPGQGQGQRTDVHVTAIDRSLGVPREWCCIVEVKGSWNDELKTAMRTQLAERYIKAPEAAAGIYLVAWAHCDGWDDPDDAERRNGPFISIEEARLFLGQQATELRGSLHMDIRAFVVDARLQRPPSLPQSSTVAPKRRRLKKGMGAAKRRSGRKNMRRPRPKQAPVGARRARRRRK